MTDLKRWTVVFKALANENRLKIIEILTERGAMSVSDIAEVLKISPKATSNHLAILRSLGVLGARGTEGHVLYSVNGSMPKDFREAIELI